MQKIIMIMGFGVMLAACGKNNENAQPVQEINGSDPLTTFNIDSFVGNFDLVNAENGDCAASMQIIKICEGGQARNNHLASQSFCNVNKGEVRSGDKRSSTTVTLDGKVIKSVALIFDERSVPPGRVKQVVTNTLTLEDDVHLRKVSDSKQSNCLYQKR